MDFAVVSTDTIVRMKKAAAITLATERLIDKNIAAHCELLNKVSGVATVYSCEGHLTQEDGLPRRPYIMMACTRQGLPFVEALMKAALDDPTYAVCHCEVTLAELPWVENSQGYEYEPQDFYYAWILRGDTSDHHMLMSQIREHWLVAINNTIKQFS
jgi:hypothetical protein